MFKDNHQSWNKRKLKIRARFFNLSWLEFNKVKLLKGYTKYYVFSFILLSAIHEDIFLNHLHVLDFLQNIFLLK